MPADDGTGGQHRGHRGHRGQRGAFTGQGEGPKMDGEVAEEGVVPASVPVREDCACRSVQECAALCSRQCVPGGWRAWYLGRGT